MYASDTIWKIACRAFYRQESNYCANKSRGCRIVHKLCNRSILDTINDLIHNKVRHKEPLARLDWIAKPILNFNIHLSRTEYAMDNIFEFYAVDIE